MATIGVLALQGDFAEHLAALKKLGVQPREVRLPGELDGLDGLIIPGGESTSMARLMDIYGLREPLKERVRSGMTVWGTCAGMILLATKLTEDRPEPLGLMNIEVQRNGYGRQVDSFEADLPVPVLQTKTAFHAVFIRAPKVLSVGKNVTVLASLSQKGEVVAAQQDGMLATSFHPELTEDTRFHQYFLKMVGVH
ncbi:MAG: pyridoxal 5'-phosphate synthase glutaminase subunit PdxT [Dehalococcoidia bacterium]|nr:pyridoxal 5'-phosphate synthase glutaminase subunit PdxT [Dehalococcoidia bacterium]